MTLTHAGVASEPEQLSAVLLSSSGPLAQMSHLDLLALALRVTFSPPRGEARLTRSRVHRVEQELAGRSRDALIAYLSPP